MASETLSDIARLSPAAENIDPFDQDVIPFPRPQPDIQDDSDSSTSDSPNPQKSTPSKPKAKKSRKPTHQPQKSNPSLRPAKDILSRFRHDPALDESEYIIGYHDRHADVMEMPVAAWKGLSDFTDEEWIPQHRILYFRKKGDEDGRKVWDRAARLDRVFGSGIVPTSEEALNLEDTVGNEEAIAGDRLEKVTGVWKDPASAAPS